MAIVALAAGDAQWSAPVVGAQPSEETFVVTSSDDSGPGSLRWAIDSANGNGPEHDLISFAIPSPPGEVPPLIGLQSALRVTTSMTIDGTTQGTAGGPSIRATVHHSFEILQARNVTVRGLSVLSDSRITSVVVGLGASDVVIEDNEFRVLGYDNGRAEGFAIFVLGDRVLVQRNDIATAGSGVVVGYQSSAAELFEGVVIRDNHIHGAGPGHEGLPHPGHYGVELRAESYGTQVGPGNVIEGHTYANISVTHAQRNVVIGNEIGSPTLSEGVGVELTRDASFNGVFGNSLAGNDAGGVALTVGASSNWVLGNNIGGNPSQTASVGTQAHGVILGGDSQ